MAFPMDNRVDALRRLQSSLNTRQAANAGVIAPLRRTSSSSREVAEASRELQKAGRSASSRILSDRLARQGDPREMIATIRQIQKGEEDDSAGGILGVLGQVAGKGLEGLGYVLGRPLAVVASAGKELFDLPSGEASFSDFVGQALAKDTTISKYLPKSGNKWLDGIVGFVGDVALDPLTYVTFGASAYAGRSGRLLLAAKAAEKSNLEKIPSLLAKVNDGSIARLGEWALTAAEKEALGINSGVSWAFRSKAVIGKQGTRAGKVSEKTAAVVGKNFAKGRAKVGDIPIFRPLQEATSLASAKNAKLSKYGRVKDDPETTDIIARLGAYSAAARANGAARLVDAQFGSRGQDLVKNITDYEANTGRRIFQVIEGTRTAADDVEQGLADNARKFLTELREYSNQATNEVANRRNMAAYNIGEIENYIPHTLTQEAKDWIAKNYPSSSGRTQTNLRRMLDMSPDEFRKGTPPLRARTLETNGTWLGQPLKTEIPGTAKNGVPGTGLATMDEINAISRDKLKFNWFEEDGGQYISNYLDSIVSQTKRVSFVDRLFDYGPDVVRTYSQKIIPNKKLQKQFQKTLDIIDGLTDDLLDDYVRFASEDVEDLLAPRLALAQDIADTRPGELLSPERITSIRSNIDNAVKAMAEADGIAGTMPSELREGYEAIMAPMRVRINDMRNALDSNDQEGLAALVGLRELYQRIFPDADLIPGDPRALAEDIIDGVTAMRGGLQAAEDAGQLGDTAVSAARGLELPVPGGMVYATPAEGRQAVANLEKLLQQKQNTLDARIGLAGVIDGNTLEGQSAAAAARQEIAGLQDEISEIAAQRDETIQDIAMREYADADNAGRTDAGTRLSEREKDLKNTRVSAQRRTSRREAEVTKLQATVDAVTPLDVAREQWDVGVGAVYRESIDNIARVAAERPAGTEAAESTARWLAKTARTLDAINAPGLNVSPAERDVLERVLMGSKGMEAELADLEMARSFNAAQLDRAVTGDLAKVVDDTIRGWTKIESLGVQMPPDVRDLMFDRVQLLKNPKEAAQFKKMYDAYTKFFKVTAMLTPGFVVRNSYTASFNNFVAGVTLPETLEGLRFATSAWKNGLDGALAKVPAKKRKLYERALQVAYSSGAGQTADDILAPVLSKRGNRLLNTRGIKQWSQANETAEMAARFSLAMSSLKRGMDYDAALNQVSRYHFDYTDISSFDETMRRFIPFWTFASRNIPLQLVNQAARPSLYRRYEALRTNFGVSEDDKTVYPRWLEDRRPLQFPGMSPGSVINPDLPFVDMQEQMRMFSDPMRLLSMANPLVKLPMELAGGRQFYLNIPFSDKKSDVSGPLDWPALLAGLATGGAGRRPDGSYYTTQRAAYALPNLLPTLGQLQRVLPKIPFTDIKLGGKEGYRDRQSSSAASYFGLPYRRVSAQEQTNELTRRQFAIQNYLSNLTRTGYLTPKEK